MANKNFEDEILDKYGVDYGDILRSSIVTTFSNVNDDDDITSAPILRKSEFLKPDNIEKFMHDRKSEFTILSLNVNSINKKIEELSIFS